MPDKNYLCLLTISESINKILSFSGTFSSADEFYDDVKSFDAVMMNFVIIGEQVIKMDDTFKENYGQINWQKIRAFRNIVAHDYFGIDAEEVWGIINYHLPPLKNSIELLIEKINKK